jgi:hypothetical protein
VYVFGWTESDLCKRNLESYILKNGLTNASLSAIETEIANNYVLKDWKKFDYLSVEIPTFWYFISIAFNIIGVGVYLLLFRALTAEDCEDYMRVQNNRKQYGISNWR